MTLGHSPEELGPRPAADAGSYHQVHDASGRELRPASAEGRLKVAVTGHTAGIGLAVAEAFRARGDAVVGLSRSTGFDVSDPQRIVEAASECDVLINNRHQYNDDSQLQVLLRLAERWRGQDRMIVNLGSRAGDCYILGRQDEYSVYKHAIDAACEQLTSRPGQLPRVVNVRPGFVDTESVQGRLAFKLAAGDVAHVVLWVVDQPKHLLVSQVTLAHHTSGAEPPRPDLARRVYWKLARGARAVKHRLAPGGSGP